MVFAISPVSLTACPGRAEASKREPSLQQGYLSGEHGPGVSVPLALSLRGHRHPPWGSESVLVAVSVEPST